MSVLSLTLFGCTAKERIKASDMRYVIKETDDLEDILSYVRAINFKNVKVYTKDELKRYNKNNDEYFFDYLISDNLNTIKQLKAIIDKVHFSEKMGVCLDTCHINDAGYNIVDSLDAVFEEFDKKIGLARLKAIHINDSMNPLGSHKDRHQCIGQGHIGLDAFARFINHPTTKNIPMYLETPNDEKGYAKEIALLKSLYNE